MAKVGGAPIIRGLERQAKAFQPREHQGRRSWGMLGSSGASGEMGGPAQCTRKFSLYKSQCWLHKTYPQAFIISPCARNGSCGNQWTKAILPQKGRQVCECACACTSVYLFVETRSGGRSLRNGFEYGMASGSGVNVPFKIPSTATRM